MDYSGKNTISAIGDFVKGKIPTVSNPNLLINPDFRINQRAFKGIQFPSDLKHIYYTVDRWAVQPGQGMIVNSDGTVTIYGGCIQKIEKDVGDNVTASVGVVSGSAVANYDPQTKTFSITTDGESAIISWAKLEIGSAATAFLPPDPATELLKCMRYYEIIMSANCDRAMPASLRPDLKGEIDFQFKIPKRAIPSLVPDTLRFVIATSKGYSTTNLSVQKFASDINGMCLITVDTVLTELPTNLLSVTVDTWKSGALAVEAEIQ